MLVFIEVHNIIVIIRFSNVLLLLLFQPLSFLFWASLGSVTLWWNHLLRTFPHNPSSNFYPIVFSEGQIWPLLLHASKPPLAALCLKIQSLPLAILDYLQFPECALLFKTTLFCIETIYNNDMRLVLQGPSFAHAPPNAWHVLQRE